MDVAMYEGELFNLTAELGRHEESARKRVLEKYKKAAEKKAMTCPYCQEQLLLRAGEVRDAHFAHLSGQTCQESNAYDTYTKQLARESPKHTVMKEIIYNELKGQERLRPDLKVEYGYKEKAKERWSQYPDIYLNNNGREFAISILTQVHELGDRKVVKTIDSRNNYFAAKKLETIWFVEDRELADDYEHRVLHLWEAEYSLAVKTEEDRLWDKLLQELNEEFPEHNLYALFGYHTSKRLQNDVRSLYYVHSIGDEIAFSVYRLVLDQRSTPFRAFALTKGYQMNISQALVVRDDIQLSDPRQEEADRIAFAHQVLQQIENHRAEVEAKALAEEEEQAAIEAIEKAKALALLRRESSRLEKVQQERPTYYRASAEAVVDEGAALFTSDIDVMEYVAKLHNQSLLPQEAKVFYHYLRLHRGELGDYRLIYADVKKSVRYALGKISDPKLREWLVEMDELR